MPSMSYCRWENTSNDLRACVSDLVEALDEGKTALEFYESLSEYERNGFRIVMQQAQELMDMIGDEDEIPF